MTDDEDDFAEIVSTKLEQVSIPTLSVVVDFNMLLSEHGLAEAFSLIGQLKDLLSTNA